MTLEDKFYPEDGSRLTQFDNFMIRSAGKVGEAYQHITGRSYRALVDKCYKTSAVGLGIGAMALRPTSLFFSLLSLSKVDYPNYLTPLEEEIRDESKGFPRKIGKIFRISLFAFASIAIYSSYPLFERGINKNQLFMTYLGAGGIVEGLSLVPFTFAEYLTKAQVPKPPKKTVFERAKERINKLLDQDPLPQPLPLPS